MTKIDSDEVSTVKRRKFLAAGAGLAGSGSWAGLGDPAIAQGVAKRLWVCPPNRYQIALNGPALTLDCLAPGMLPDDGWQSAPEGAGEPLVTIGPQEQPVSWALAAWDQPDRFTQNIALQATDRPLQAHVTFTVDEPSGLLARRTELRHSGSGETDIRSTLGFSAAIHEPIRRIFHLSGGWMEEANIQRVHPGAGELTLESRAGKTGFDFQPYLALRTDTSTYLCQLLWSGNWTLRVVPGQTGAIVLGGFNNWQFRHRLRAGDSLELPTVLFGRFDGPLGIATRHLHDYRRAHRPDPDRAIPVQF
ncbi:MAG: glycoside hydrolase family 36 N-terminal domain-containing protein, partial [Reyranellales bacterium]